MNRAGQFFLQNFVYPALSLNPVQIRETFRRDFNPEMRLAFGPGTHMTGMLMGLVDHGQGNRVKGCS